MATAQGRVVPIGKRVPAGTVSQGTSIECKPSGVEKVVVCTLFRNGQPVVSYASTRIKVAVDLECGHTPHISGKFGVLACKGPRRR